MGNRQSKTVIRTTTQPVTCFEVFKEPVQKGGLRTLISGQPHTFLIQLAFHSSACENPAFLQHNPETANSRGYKGELAPIGIHFTERREEVSGTWHIDCHLEYCFLQNKIPSSHHHVAAHGIYTTVLPLATKRTLVFHYGDKESDPITMRRGK